MKIRTTFAAATAATMIAAGTPAVANAQIVAPEPSSQIMIPGDVTNFFDSILPLNRHDTEQVLKVVAAWWLVGIATSVVTSLIYFPLRATNAINGTSRPAGTSLPNNGTSRPADGTSRPATSSR